MTKYYFAGRYSRHAELAIYRDRLVTFGVGEVTSRWIDCHDGELENSYTPEELNTNPEKCWVHGYHDLEDLEAASVIVSFTGDGGGGKGGRHIEHGYAIKTDREYSTPMRLVIIGPRENIFHCHPATEVYETFDKFLSHEVALDITKIF